jgi:tetratricopeptide (TPR) repeat protein
MRIRRLFHASLFILCVPLLLAGSRPAGAGQAQGIAWRDISVEKALLQGAQEKRIVMLAVYATWCPYCRRQDAEVWQTDAADAFRNTIPVRVDFDSPEGKAVKKKYNILGLPSVLFLRPKGGEIDRITGYEEKADFLDECKPLLRGVDPLPDLRKKLEKSPEDPVLLMEVGRRELERGNLKEAIRLFEKIQSVDPKNASSRTAQTYDLLGRYYSRVMEDPQKALPYWKTLFEKYTNNDLAQVALAWGLSAYDSLGKFDEGFAWASGVVKSTPGKWGGALAYALVNRTAKKKVHVEECLDLLKKAREAGFDAAKVDKLESALKGLNKE